VNVNVRAEERAVNSQKVVQWRIALARKSSWETKVISWKHADWRGVWLSALLRGEDARPTGSLFRDGLFTCQAQEMQRAEGSRWWLLEVVRWKSGAGDRKVPLSRSVRVRDNTFRFIIPARNLLEEECGQS
jgi:hypothetical protein